MSCTVVSIKNIDDNIFTSSQN